MTEIMRVAARGDGVTADGRHAAFAAPGDMLTNAGEVIAGPHHQTPPCRHFPQCGGCQLQHLDDASYAGFVADRIATALDAQGLKTAIRPTALSPPRTRRRATLHADRGLVGFAEEASHRIVDMRECHVLHPALFALVAPLRPLLQRLRVRGRAELHLTLADQGPDLLLKAKLPDGLAAAEALTDFAQAHGLARLAVEDGYGAEDRWAPQPVTITLSGRPVSLPHAAFLQATAEGEAALVAAVREATAGAATAADLFAGLGTFALALPAKVYAAEGARNALFALQSAGQGRVFTEHRDLFRRPLTTAELDRFDAIVLDPPRAGAREQVAQLAISKARRLAYVSCNPASFARDAKVLIDGGWRLDWVQPVGQFRWSTHVELAAAFSHQ